MRALAALLLVASCAAAYAVGRTQGTVRQVVQYGDTVRVRRGLDTVSLKIAVPATFPTGKYWWHLHGPNLVTSLPYRGVVIVSAP